MIFNISLCGYEKEVRELLVPNKKTKKGMKDE